MGSSSEGVGKTVLDVLQLLGWNDMQIESLLKSVPEDGWIEGAFRVMLKAKGGRKASVNRAVLEEAFRNLDPASIGLLGEGSSERQGMVKLAEARQISAVGDMLDPAKAMSEIVKMLKYWSDTGRIDCTF